VAAIELNRLNGWRQAKNGHGSQLINASDWWRSKMAGENIGAAAAVGATSAGMVNRQRRNETQLRKHHVGGGWRSSVAKSAAWRSNRGVRGGRRRGR